MKVIVDLKVPKQKMSQNSIDKGQYALSNQALADMNQFVPFKEDPLRISGTVADDGKSISWDTPYAKAQFYGFVGKGGYRVYNYTTPGTSRRWDLRGKAIYMKDWTKAFMKGAGW